MSGEGSYRYLVGFADVNKLIKVTDKRDVEVRSHEAFGVSEEYCVEYYDNVFEAYVQPDSPEDLPSGGKLRLVKRRGHATQSAVEREPENDPLRLDNMTDDRSSHASSLEDAGLTADKVNVQRGRTEDGVSISSMDTVIVSPEAPGGSKPASTNCPSDPLSSDAECEKDFYNPAVLTRHLRMKLESGARTLKTSEMSQLLDAVYAGFTNSRDADTPTKKEYDTMVSELLTKHPSLRGNLTLADAMTWLKRLLRDKFRNKRAKVKRQRALEDEPSMPPPEAKRRRVAGLKNYLPAVAVTAVQQQRLKNVLRNAAESADERDDALEDSFAGRRQEAIKGEDILELYPRLLEDRGFYREADRLAGHANVIAEKTEDVSAQLDEVGQYLQATDRGDTLKQLMKLLGVSPDALQGDERVLHPHYEEGGRVCAGRWLFAAVEDEVERLVVLIFAFSVMNCRFPKHAQSFLFYVQLYMMGIDAGEKVPQRVLKIRQQLLQ